MRTNILDWKCQAGTSRSDNMFLGVTRGHRQIIEQMHHFWRTECYELPDLSVSPLRGGRCCCRGWCLGRHVRVVCRQQGSTVSVRGELFQ